MYNVHISIKSGVTSHYTRTPQLNVMETQRVKKNIINIFIISNYHSLENPLFYAV